MEINLETVKSLAAKAYMVHARQAFGEAGTTGIRELLDAVKLIFQRAPPESLPGTLTVVQGINSTPSAPAIVALGPLTALQTHEQVGKALVAAEVGSHAAVELVPDGTFRVLFSTVDFDVQSLAQSALVYRFEHDTERILAKDFNEYIPKLSPVLKSNFAVPTLASLEAAFERYAAMALDSQCLTLATVWEGGVDGPRLVLVNKPESLMRDSLVHALSLLTRDTSVRPEQNTDETKPVDIRVEWFGSGASALIEVKWLGRSIAKQRIPKPHLTYTDYGPDRAQKGADQLADYMDRQVRHSNASAPKGYLVVFDARRANVQGASDPLSKADALYFANEEIGYTRDYSKERSDFAPPVRFYLRPRPSHFLAA